MTHSGTDPIVEAFPWPQHVPFTPFGKPPWPRKNLPSSSHFCRIWSSPLSPNWCISTKMQYAFWGIEIFFYAHSFYFSDRPVWFGLWVCREAGKPLPYGHYAQRPLQILKWSYLYIVTDFISHFIFIFIFTASTFLYKVISGDPAQFVKLYFLVGIPNWMKTTQNDKSQLIVLILLFVSSSGWSGLIWSYPQPDK